MYPNFAIFSILSAFAVLCTSVIFVPYYRKNNVCRNLTDYYTIHTSRNCWYNPDVNSSPKHIAKRHGYILEKHIVITPDRYILSLHRIPGKIKGDVNKARRPILIQHGAAGSSALMMMQGNRSIAFILANHGFDVWLLNSRESYYSTHLTMNQTQKSYWNFGINEMALYDLPTCIDFVAKNTGQKGEIVYIGHSLGTTTSYIYAIKKKQHAKENLKAIVSMAPVAYMQNVVGAVKTVSPVALNLSKILRGFGINALNQFHEMQVTLLENTCGRYLIGTCSFLINDFSGTAPNQFQPELIPLLFSYYPAALSLKTITQLMQFINSNGQFREFDYGSKRNLRIYKQTEPPEYASNDISIPVHLFVGIYDNLSGLEDSTILLDSINANRSQKVAWMHILPFSHMDFILGKHVEDFYGKLLEVIRTLR